MPTLHPGTYPTATKLDLDSNDFTVIETKDLPDAPSLTEISLSYNKLTSHPDLSQYHNLTKVTSVYNQITHLDKHIFPKSLYELDLYHNSLTEIKNLGKTNIKQLRLDSNKISDPAGKLPISLVILAVKDNLLTGVPPSIKHLERLNSLSLDHNRITSIDDVIFPSNSLDDVNLSYNNITSIALIQFTDPTNNTLERLRLYSNPLTSIAKDAFKYLKQLKVLSLSSTKLTRLPLALADLTSMKSLDLSYNTDMACTCEEASLSTWYTSIGSGSGCMSYWGKTMCSYTVTGNCQGGTSVRDFLSTLAPKCTVGGN